ncbi:TetR/AcrR family transcriptional regulator [Paracoccus sp. (in: a-proteobacteria)]|uniref:TetR/AcrR family transcriptional regulator n=1 Tax=Paracoccus sp. TaxID=267 RepID=UPI00396CD392
MTNLRDRRRRETARDIQVAALGLSLRDGYCTATTDAIAAEAGISTRTFFNYYPNKQAAILGVPPVLDAEAGAWIVTSNRPILNDILRLLNEMLMEDAPDRRILCMIGQLIDRTPELRPLFSLSLDRITLTLAGLLQQRLGETRLSEAQLLAALATHALSNAVRAWGLDPDMPDSRIIEQTRDQLENVGQLMCKCVRNADGSAG